MNGMMNTLSESEIDLPQVEPKPIKLVVLVEAISVNAVAKNVMEFHRTARDFGKNPFGHDMSFITFDRTRDPNHQSEFVRVGRASGLEIEVIPESAPFDLRVIPALRRLIRRRAPDIVVTHQVKSHFLMKVSGLNRRYPWVAFHHGYTSTDRKMRAYNHLNRWSLPAAAKVITVCEAFAKDLQSAGVRRERIHVQHNSIRPEPKPSNEEVKALKASLGVAEDARVILSVGRLSREKAHVDLLAACKHLHDILPSTKTRLVIVGDGPERTTLEATVQSLGIADKVVFTGEVTGIEPYYAAADVMVLPSHSEGSPYVLLEAMAAEIPVVATAVGGVPEMVEDEQTALLVPAGDSQAMATSIARILTEAGLGTRLTSNAAKLTLTRYSPETYFRSVSEIYRGLLE